ncbi:hypothetical protein SFC66_03850 [Terribacillus saccharophilus]|uniref:hypothetical protein n=1 Tax=Terribacillus saccharophilus TaxID=361277 RepID=UPI0039819631
MKKVILPFMLLAVLLIAGCGSQTSSAKTEQENAVPKEEEKATPPTYKMYFQTEQQYEDFKQAVKDENLQFDLLQQEPQLDYAYYGKLTYYPDEKFTVRNMTKYKEGLDDTGNSMAVDGFNDFYFDDTAKDDNFYEVTKEEMEFADNIVNIQSGQPVNGARNPDDIDADFAQSDERFEKREKLNSLYGSVIGEYHSVHEGYMSSYMDLENSIVPSAGVDDTLDIALADNIFKKRENIEGQVVLDSMDDDAYDKLNVMEAIAGLQDRKQALEDAKNNALYERDSFEKIYDFYKAYAEYKGEMFDEEPMDAAFLKEYKDDYNTYLDKVEKEQKRLDKLMAQVEDSKFAFLLEN